jgi:hypothetical protein
MWSESERIVCNDQEAEEPGCGRFKFRGTENALYERRIGFDNIVEWMAAYAVASSGKRCDSFK